MCKVLISYHPQNFVVILSCHIRFYWCQTKNHKKNKWIRTFCNKQKSFFLVSLWWHSNDSNKRQQSVKRDRWAMLTTSKIHFSGLNRTDFGLPSVIIEQSVIMYDERHIQQHFVKQTAKKWVLSTHFVLFPLSIAHLRELVRVYSLCLCVTYACFIFGFYIYLRGIFCFVSKMKLKSLLVIHGDHGNLLWLTKWSILAFYSKNKLHNYIICGLFQLL